MAKATETCEDIYDPKSMHRVETIRGASLRQRIKRARRMLCVACTRVLGGFRRAGPFQE